MKIGLLTDIAELRQPSRSLVGSSRSIDLATIDLADERLRQFTDRLRAAAGERPGSLGRAEDARA